MKYIIAIVVGAVIIGVGLSLAVFALLGDNPGYFFAKFVAAPVGLMGAVLGFFLYDSLWPKRKP
jgi:uncharacterized membrane protein YiaA